VSKTNQQYLDRKTEARFAQLDHDGNGFIEWHDYLSEAQSVLQCFGVEEHSTKGQAVLQAYRNKWADLAAAADTNGDGQVSLEEFTVHMADPNYCAAQAEQLNRAIGEAIMELADRDGDGRISFDEFRRFPTPARAGEALASQAFHRLDRDGDGFVSKEEVHTLMEHYLSSSDQTALGNQVFGQI
jgi:Ca2+-binding EF-hand superfamily protein